MQWIKCTIMPLDWNVCYVQKWKILNGTSIYCKITNRKLLWSSFHESLSFIVPFVFLLVHKHNLTKWVRVLKCIFQDVASEILSVGPIQQEDLDPQDSLSLVTSVKDELIHDDPRSAMLRNNEDRSVAVPGSESHHHIMVECELEEHDGEILLVKWK